MAERKYRGKRVGTAEDAAAICGVKVDTYRYYVTRLEAPGPLEGFGRRNPATGRMSSEFDLDAVEAWDKARKGRGYRSDLDRPDWKPAGADRG